MLQEALLALTYYTLGLSQCPKLVWTYFQLAPLKDSSGAGPHSSEKSFTDFPKSLLKISTDLPEICNSQKWKISELVFKDHNNLLSVCPAPLGSLGLRYHMKTQGAVRSGQPYFATARTWAKPHRFDTSITFLLRRVVQNKNTITLKYSQIIQKEFQISKISSKFSE